MDNERRIKPVRYQLIAANQPKAPKQPVELNSLQRDLRQDYLQPNSFSSSNANKPKPEVVVKKTKTSSKLGGL